MIEPVEERIAMGRKIIFLNKKSFFLSFWIRPGFTQRRKKLIKPRLLLVNRVILFFVLRMRWSQACKYTISTCKKLIGKHRNVQLPSSNQFLILIFSLQDSNCQYVWDMVFTFMKSGCQSLFGEGFCDWYLSPSSAQLSGLSPIPGIEYSCSLSDDWPLPSFFNLLVNGTRC